MNSGLLFALLLRFILPFAIAVIFLWVAFRIAGELNRIEARLKEIRNEIKKRSEP